MPEFSKFRLITVGIILMFIFVVAAIYTNTKDAANSMKEKEQQEIKINEIPQLEEQPEPEISETEKQLQNLTERIDYLEKKAAQTPEVQPAARTEGVRCSIKGIVANGRLVPLSAQDSVNESKNNGNDVFIICNFSITQ